MFRFLGRLTVTHPGIICISWLLFGGLLTLIAPSSRNTTQDDDIRFLPPETPSLRAHQLLEQAFPPDVCASNVLFAVERPANPLTSTDLALVDRLITRLETLKRDEPALQINGVVSRKNGVIGNRFMSADGYCTLMQVALATPYIANQTRTTVDRCEAVLREEMRGTDAGLTLYTTGPAGVGRDLVAAGGAALDQTTWATVGLVIVVLLCVYRSPILALVPLITIGISAWVSLNLLALVAIIPGVHVMNISQIFAIVILFGAGTDYCLFLISRYREELERGESTSRSVRRSVAAVGEALAASAGTVICGLAMMGFADFAKIRCAGPVIALALVVGLAASLTLTPAFLQLTGAKAFWPGRIHVRKRGERRRTFWGAVSKLVVRRPGLVWIVTFAVLVPFAFLGLRATPVFSPVGDLAPSSKSVQGLAVIRQRFCAGETGPITVLLASDTDWESDEGKKLIRYLSQGFGRISNISEVRSLTQPLGKPMELAALGTGLFKALGKVDPMEQVRTRYLSKLTDGIQRNVTRIDVVLKSDPFLPESIQTLTVLDHWLTNILPTQTAALGSVRTETFGVTVHTRDLATVIEHDRAKVNMLVLGGVFLILLVLVRQPWLAAYLLATVLFSYYATLGATTIFATLYTGKPLGVIEWRVPFFLFIILVAVGEDYNILMVTRALQERRRFGAEKGIRRGLARTGGTITACGVIMAGTFMTLMISGLGTLVQVGFALAVGVLIDTLLIRPLLVPAFMLMVWKDEGEPTKLRIASRSRRAA
ncbi:MAG: MMPL family transporter [Gemmataceae bacterium]